MLQLYKLAHETENRFTHEIYTTSKNVVPWILRHAAVAPGCLLLDTSRVFKNVLSDDGYEGEVQPEKLEQLPNSRFPQIQSLWEYMDSGTGQKRRQPRYVPHSLHPIPRAKSISQERLTLSWLGLYTCTSSKLPSSSEDFHLLGNTNRRRNAFSPISMISCEYWAGIRPPEVFTCESLSILTS